MATASVLWVSGEIAPSDMACVLKRPSSDASVSTSSSGRALASAHLQQVADRDRLSFCGRVPCTGLIIFVGRKLDVAMHSPHDFRRSCVPLALLAETIEARGPAAAWSSTSQYAASWRSGNPAAARREPCRRERSRHLRRIGAHVGIETDDFEQTDCCDSWPWSRCPCAPSPCAGLSPRRSDSGRHHRAAGATACSSAR